MNDRKKDEPGAGSPVDPPGKDTAVRPIQPSPALAAGWPLPEELLRNRREWARTLKEKNTRQGDDSHMDQEPESKAPADRDPPRR